jgi:hypothetical protein
VTVFVSNADELDTRLFAGTDSVAITAGASTPGWIIKEVSEKMNEENMKAAEMPVTELQRRNALLKRTVSRRCWKSPSRPLPAEKR